MERASETLTMTLPVAGAEGKAYQAGKRERGLQRAGKEQSEEQKATMRPRGKEGKGRRAASGRTLRSACNPLWGGQK